MKNILLLTLLGSLALSNAPTLLPHQRAKPPEVKFSHIKTTIIQLPYHYDSVKMLSPYPFDSAKSTSTQAFARIVYPVFGDQEINNIIRNAVLSPLTVEYPFKSKFAAAHPALSDLDAVNKPASDYAELASKFLTSFEVQAPGEDLKAYWYADINVTVLRNTPDYLACLCKKDYFTGGSHDLYDFKYLNYDVRNRRLITLQSQLKPAKLSELTGIAERIFRKNEGLTPDQKLRGYFFDDDKFSLPERFTITEKGLMFFYTYYEIKPFAAGTTELVIPFSYLKGIALPGSILAKQIAGH